MILEKSDRIGRRAYLQLASGTVVSTQLLDVVGGNESSSKLPAENSAKSKLKRLDTYLAENDLEAVWFKNQNSFAWLTGYSNTINRSTSSGVAAVGYDRDDLTVVTANNQAGVVREETFQTNKPQRTARFPVDTVDVKVVNFKWYNSLGEAVAKNSPSPAAADFDVPGFEQVAASSLRQPLTLADVERYRTLSKETATAVEAVCHELRPEDTERNVATAIRCALSTYGIEDAVMLVGGEKRAQKYRHPVPTDEKLGGYAVVSVVGQRLGLNVSCTRMVAFEPPAWLEKRHNVAMRIDATALAATQAAIESERTAKDVFDVIQAAYEEAGYPAEWKQHHQGGAAGYAGREWIATPTLDADITAPMAYAWNPTVQGTKSEGTVLVTKNGHEPLTLTGNWPAKTVQSYKHDVSITRPDILYRSC